MDSDPVILDNDAVIYDPVIMDNGAVILCLVDRIDTSAHYACAYIPDNSQPELQQEVFESANFRATFCGCTAGGAAGSAVSVSLYPSLFG